MDRRGFLKLLSGATAAAAAAPLIPFNRVWSFPKEIVLPRTRWQMPYFAGVDYGFDPDITVVRGAPEWFVETEPGPLYESQRNRLLRIAELQRDIDKRFRRHWGEDFEALTGEPWSADLQKCLELPPGPLANYIDYDCARGKGLLVD